MDTETKFSNLFSFLMIAALLLSYSMDGVSTSNSSFYSSAQKSSLCKKAQITSSVDTQPAGLTQGNEDTAPSQGATAVSSSCSISLQVIPVKKHELISPSVSSLVFPLFTPDISSQAFVFQELDPPQAI